MRSDYKMKYGARLHQLRIAKKFSIYRLHKETGLSQGHITDLERDKHQPTLETLQRLLTAMDISLAEFFNENGEVSYLSKREKELVAIFRAMSNESAELYLRFGKALNKK